MVYKSLTGLAPNYLATLVEYHHPPAKLRSSRKNFVLKENRFNLQTMGRRAFSNCGPRLWNTLPDSLRDITLTVNQFKKKLKTHLFDEFIKESAH